MISVFDQGSATPCPAPFNMAAHVLGLASAQGTLTALSVVHRDRRVDWTYRQLQAAVRGVGTGLLNAGLMPGQIVLIRLGNSVDFPIAYLGAIAVGLVPVPTSAQLTTPEVARMIDELAPAAILHDPNVPCPDHPNRIPVDALQDMFTLPPCDWHMGDPNRMGYIVYTSGTSGNPRAVAHAHRAIWARRMMIRGWYDLKPDDRLLHAGAFSWTYTLGTGLMDPWSIGATALIAAPGTEIDAIPALLQTHRATIFAAAPGVFRKMLLTNRHFDTPSLRHALSAGEKLSQPLRDQWAAATGTKIHEAYGMSECSTFISSSPAHPTTGHALGRPQTGRRVAIVNTQGPVPMGTPGTIAIDQSDPGLMLGYLGAAEETRARMQGEWFLTGDIGQMDPGGQITYLGRNDDMMNPGGTRVSPLEVEATLAKYPGLTEVGVAQVAIKPGVNIIAAFYTAPAPLDEVGLRRYVGANLARYKQPRAFIHVPSLPTGANGKLLRSALPAYFPAYLRPPKHD